MANEIMMQSFEWDTDGSGDFYKKLSRDAKDLKKRALTPFGFHQLVRVAVTMMLVMESTTFGTWENLTKKAQSEPSTEPRMN